MRFYKLAGSEQYVSWDTLHNVAGYSEQATNEITWKSVENWGTSAGIGYELPVELFASSELFMDDVFGWHDLDWFALEQGVYPSSASDMVLTHPTYGSSPVVFMVFDDGTYYLIQKDISQGWMTEEEYTERGWQLPGYIVLNSETGAILGAAKGHELETVPVPACVIANPEMVSVPIPARVLESPEMVVYVPVVVELPEVSTTGDFSEGNWLYTNTGGTNISVPPDATTRIFQYSGSSFSYDSEKSYAVIFWASFASQAGEGRTEFSIVEYNSWIRAKNITGGTLYLYALQVAVCSSNQATVVPVYDSSNNAYNAFKYTTNNTDYYYVLDGTQTDWTDDLASIGYSLEPEPEYEQINLYIPGGGSNTYYFQEGITSSSAWDPAPSYTITLYDSSSMNSVARVRPGVRYESGYISNGEWIPDSVQSLSDMPSTATSDSGSRKDAELFQTLYGTVSLWFVTSYSTSGVNLRYGNDPQPLVFRLYPAQYIDVILALNGNGTGVTFSADDYWASNVKATDVMYSLRDFGVPTRTASDSSQSIVIDRTAFENFTFVPIALYTDTAGTVDAGADMSNFYCKVGGDGTGMYGTSVNIRSINAYNTTVCRWKCRITKINGGN